MTVGGGCGGSQKEQESKKPLFFPAVNRKLILCHPGGKQAPGMVRLVVVLFRKRWIRRWRRCCRSVVPAEAPFARPAWSGSIRLRFHLRVWNGLAFAYMWRNVNSVVAGCKAAMLARLPMLWARRLPN